MSVGEIPRARLPELARRVNQFDGTTPYARRTGDYLYATDLAHVASVRPTVKVAINSYVAATPASRIAMLGWDAPGLVQAPGTSLMLGQIVSNGIARG